MNRCLMCLGAVMAVIVLTGSTTIVSRVTLRNSTNDFILCWTGERSNPSDCVELTVSGLHLEKCEADSFCLSRTPSEDLQYVKLSTSNSGYYCKQCMQLQNYESNNIASSSECQLKTLSLTSCTKFISVLRFMANEAKETEDDIGTVSVPECPSIHLLSCSKPKLRQSRGIRSGSGAFGKIESDGSEDGSNIVMYVVVGVVVVVLFFLVYWFFIRD